MASSYDVTPTGAFRDGLRRVNGAPWVLAGMILVTFLLALPLALLVRGALAAHLGPSAVAERVAAHADYDWWEEFMAQASGLETTFTPSVIGFAAVLENAGGVLDNRPLAGSLIVATAAWLAVWSFLCGGLIDRYARRRRTRAYGFFAACGTHFWRFVRLGVLASAAYALLFGPIHGWIFDDAYVRLTREVTMERTAFWMRLGGYALFTTLAGVVVLLFDFARVRIVVEDRRSAIAALVAAARFLRRHWSAALHLYLLNAAAFIALVAAYGLLSPGAPRTGMQMVLVLALGQAYICGRHYLKLLVYASATALFQGRMAHAGYTAAPALVWPESPAVETITNADPGSVR